LPTSLSQRFSETTRTRKRMFFFLCASYPRCQPIDASRFIRFASFMLSALFSERFLLLAFARWNHRAISGYVAPNSLLMPAFRHNTPLAPDTRTVC
jgi:hypothetical protein